MTLRRSRNLGSAEVALRGDVNDTKKENTQSHLGVVPGIADGVTIISGVATKVTTFTPDLAVPFDLLATAEKQAIKQQ